MDWMISQSSGNQLQKEVGFFQFSISMMLICLLKRLREMLTQVVQFCENTLDCRRTQLLAVGLPDMSTFAL